MSTVQRQESALEVSTALSALVKDGAYRLVVKGGRLLELSEAGRNGEFMTMEEIAEEFRASYWSISRWSKKLRLHAYRLGKTKLFKRAEVHAAIERTATKLSDPVGRPKKTIGVIR